jgi:hypothetical protein
LLSTAWAARPIRAGHAGPTGRRRQLFAVRHDELPTKTKTMSCAGQRPAVRPWRWDWAGEEWGQGPTGPWLLHQELGAAGGHSAYWRRHLVCAVVPPRLPLASPPLARRRPPLAAGPPVRFQSVCPCLQTRRSLRAAFQRAYAAVRRTSPASATASGAQLPSAIIPRTGNSVHDRSGRRQLCPSLLH